ncbi:P-loop NTPase family protein [Tautonia plasticadhaerens]|uniref:AAA+ ATPase domain-containing protein n=1 Tax=Tautonia plasticadhaerens TaxID=2527974 RepID=A0A518H807_9BACT|nr:hypothetical protein [Tautonia plasticadhaerens]QDV36974.1 hypothetical protein ElP_49050 [Tautonia plasticadhaerens]
MEARSGRTDSRPSAATHGWKRYWRRVSRQRNYVWGETGVGKTFSIERTLEEAQDRGIRSYRKLEGKCTPVGLYELARDFPDHILFIDDDPMLVQDRLSQQILLHLCGDGRIDPETGRNVRTISNVKSKGRERCQFTGSVVITNNVRLANMPVLRALQGRIRTYHFRPTTSELVAMLRHLAEVVDCYEVDLEERQEICEFIISECEHSQQQLDLRLLKHAISDYIQWKRGEVKLHWRHLVVSSLQDHFSPAPAINREDRKHLEQDRIVDLIEEAAEAGVSKEAVVEGWMAFSEKKKTAFYDRLKELPEEMQRQYQALPDKRTAASAEEQAPDPETAYVHELIEDAEGFRKPSRSMVLKVWTMVTKRSEAEFQALLGRLSPPWRARYDALPERRSDVA